MTRVAVDLDRLAEFTDRLELFAAHLSRARSEVDGRVQALHDTWTGSAAAAQLAAHETWRAGAVEVSEALAALRAVASGAHTNYAAAMHANAAMWACW